MPVALTAVRRSVSRGHHSGGVAL